MKGTPLRERIPISNTIVIVAAWGGWAYFHNTFAAVIASLITIFVLPRFFRGSLAEAERRYAEFLRQPVEPSKRTAKMMFPNEELHMEFHQHPMCMFLWWLGALTVLNGAVALRFLVSTLVPSMVIVLVAAAVLIVRIAHWRHDTLCITNKRIFVIRGWTSLRLEMMPLKKMDTQTLKQPFISTVLAWAGWLCMPYGTLRADAAGEETELNRLPFVPGAGVVETFFAERILGDYPIR